MDVGIMQKASSFESWWGTDPHKKAEADIGVAAADKESKSIQLGECKRRNDFNETTAIEVLEYRARSLKATKTRATFCLRRQRWRATAAKVNSRGVLCIVAAEGMFA